MIDENKYVVFKGSDLTPRLNALLLEVDASIVSDIQGCVLHDAVVIRKKDTFAASALYAYATAVLSAVEILDGARNGVVVDPDMLDHLTELADYFAGQADNARRLHGRMPT